jgi:hypothetical protein
MKYYLSVIQNPDSESETTVFYAYNTFNDALALYHTELAYRGEGRNATIAYINDTNGMTLAQEIWTRQENPATDIYYVLLIQNQGENESDTVFKYTTYDEALSKFHSELGYRAEGRDSTIAAILSSNGNQVRDGKYIKEVE